MHVYTKHCEEAFGFDVEVLWGDKTHKALESLDKRVVEDGNGKFRNQFKFKEWEDVSLYVFKYGAYISKTPQTFETLEELDENTKSWYEKVEERANIYKVKSIIYLEDIKNQEIIDRVNLTLNRNELY